MGSSKIDPNATGRRLGAYTWTAYRYRAAVVHDARRGHILLIEWMDGPQPYRLHSEQWMLRTGKPQATNRWDYALLAPVEQYFDRWVPVQLTRAQREACDAYITGILALRDRNPADDDDDRPSWLRDGRIDEIIAQRVLRVLRSVEGVSGIGIDALVGTTRPRPVVRARQLAVYGLRQWCGLSYPAIGRVLEKDHRTVMYAYRRAKRLLEDEAGFKASLDLAWSGFLTGAPLHADRAEVAAEAWLATLPADLRRRLRGLHSASLQAQIREVL